VTFALSAIIGAGFLLPTVQANAIGASVSAAFNIPTIIIAIIIVILLGLVIIGGVKRLAKVTELIAPFMAIAYMLAAIIIAVIEIERIPDVFLLIFKSAFGMEQILSGVFGAAIA
jgi:AGCS family alanine or glycine:cation symporter